MRFGDYELTARRILLLALILLVPAVQAMLPIDDPDIWWRFRMGEWMVSHRAVPYVDYFSAYDAGTPWIEYSWVFALLVYWIHSYLGLVGLVYFIALTGMLLAYLGYRLLRPAGLPIQVEVLLVGMALATVKSLMTPRPWLLTMLFFAVELVIITGCAPARTVKPCGACRYCSASGPMSIFSLSTAWRFWVCCSARRSWRTG